MRNAKEAGYKARMTKWQDEIDYLFGFLERNNYGKTLSPFFLKMIKVRMARNRRHIRRYSELSGIKVMWRDSD